MECFRLNQGALHHSTNEPLPIPGPNQVLVRVWAAGVCFRDLLDQKGAYPNQKANVVTGHEFAGVVMSGPKKGRRVAAMQGQHGISVDGGYATHAVVDEKLLVDVPEGVSLLQASFLHCTAAVALRGLRHHGRCKPGDSVLVTGATGGVGIHAVQIARLLGCKVYGETRSKERGTLIAPYCDKVLMAGEARQEKFDVILECVGRPTFSSSLKSIAPGGRIVVVGNVDLQPVALPLGKLIVFEGSVTGSFGGTRQDLEDVFHWAASGALKPVIHATYPLRDALKAQKVVNEAVGRVVLICDQQQNAKL